MLRVLTKYAATFPEHRLYSTKKQSTQVVRNVCDPNDPGRLAQPPGDPLNTKNEPTRDTIDALEGEWAVFRYDDHANTYLVKTLPTREQADDLAYYYEKLGHKQHFYVKNVKDMKK